MEKKSTRYEAWRKLHIVSYPELCGIGAGLSNILLTFPINKFAFRQQLESTSITKTWSMTTSILQNQKNILKYVYRGWSMPLAQKCVANSLMYGIYPRSREYLARQNSQTSLLADCLLASGAAAIVEASINTPLERLQAIIQNQKYDKKFKSLRFSFCHFYQ